MPKWAVKQSMRDWINKARRVGLRLTASDFSAQQTILSKKKREIEALLTAKAEMASKSVPTPKPKKGKVAKRVVHHVIVADDSGSMRGERQKAAHKGIVEYVKTAWNQTTELDVQVYFHLLFFGSEIKEASFAITPGNIDNKLAEIYTCKQNSTRLNDAIIAGIECVKNVPKTEQVFIVAFTDGEENASRSTAVLTSQAVKLAIAKGQSISLFSGTSAGKTYAMSIGIDETNVLLVNNTQEGFTQGLFQATQSMKKQTAQYTASGTTFSTGFYQS
jgi:hypothetical protein